MTSTTAICCQPMLEPKTHACASAAAPAAVPVHLQAALLGDRLGARLLGETSDGPVASRVELTIDGD
jgi:hypothetical protein